MFTLISLPTPPFLAFDTVYFVESPDNEPLNQAMRQIEHSHRTLFENAEMQPFPFKLLCLTREELAADCLRTRFADDFDSELVNDTIDALRECLQTDTGGTLTARCMPKFSGMVRVDDRAVCTSTEFSRTRPEKALETARQFARDVAEENFHRLSGETYYTYQRAKEEYGRPQRHFGGGGMGFVVVPPDPKEIIRKMEERLAEINGTINEQTNYDDVIEMLKADFERLDDGGKMATFCKLFVKDDKLYFKVPDTEERIIEFGRETSKALYVFYLRQIQRAKKNPGVSQFLSQIELEEYKDELFKIYQWFSGRVNCRIEDISDMWDVSKGFMFRDAISCIKKYFEREFDVDTLQKKYNKSYFCSIPNDKGPKGGRRYGVDIDVDDFDLDQFNYRIGH